MLVADQYSLTGSPHAMFIVVFLKALQPVKHRRIFFRLVFFRPKCIVTERVQADCLWLVCIEVFWKYRAVDVSIR